MRSSILITSLICWISDSQTVRVKPGEDVTMSCSNISSSPSQADWFRVVNGTQSRCIAAMFEYNGRVSYCKGFGKEKFEMSSNISTVFLKIKQVDLSDSGLYICGFYIKRNTVIATAATLKVHDGINALCPAKSVAVIIAQIHRTKQLFFFHLLDHIYSIRRMHSRVPHNTHAWFTITVQLFYDKLQANHNTL
uniref:Ig-like domain-containing protein n=1 Tax=Gouania willdenowi TaxID=441366 RepID=A0A8C5HJI7_GOUWI